MVNLRLYKIETSQIMSFFISLISVWQSLYDHKSLYFKGLAKFEGISLIV